ncbi:MAG TPA: hypothetical protein PK195_11585, partial [Ignavibacteriaceae bacterium]|nr:hypothetical protein [Ignavibacteriaceae bacterium]
LIVVNKTSAIKGNVNKTSNFVLIFKGRLIKITINEVKAVPKYIPLHLAQTKKKILLQEKDLFIS